MLNPFVLDYLSIWSAPGRLVIFRCFHKPWFLFGITFKQVRNKIRFEYYNLSSFIFNGLLIFILQPALPNIPCLRKSLLQCFTISIFQHFLQAIQFILVRIDLFE